MSDNNNPYQPPKADVTPPPVPASSMALLPEPRSVAAGSALSWLSDSWPMVKNNLGVWILITIGLFGIQFVLGLVPGLGDVASTLLGPVFTGGILMGARAVAGGEALRFDHLFAGFKEKVAPLLGLGALTLGIMFLFGIIIGGAFVGMNMDTLHGETLKPEDLLNGMNTGLIAIGVILLIFIMMLFWFATQLVALNNVPVFQALTMSFKGCLRNPLPLIFYLLLALLLVIAGAIPLLLGLLVVVPWLFASAYVSYRQIFIQ
ncbi:MAG: BPSS1780 family membrane protein [Thiothrix sp.]